MDLEIITTSVQQTIELGRRIGAQLKGGEIIGICGQLGSGKTHLIKGIAAGAGAEDYKIVNSPTFVIVNEYSGRFDSAHHRRFEIFHIDAYRLNSIEEFEMIGFDDFCYPGSVVLIEWADKVEAALRRINYTRIELFHEGATQRKIQITNAPDYIDGKVSKINS